MSFFGPLEDPVARRYFVMNTYDGVMTALGIVLGTAFSNVDPMTIFRAGLGASIAIMISGLWGAYMAERAERLAEKKEMEKLLLKKLDGTVVEEDLRKKIITNALVDGLSPFIGAFFPLLPFLFAGMGFVEPGIAKFISLAISAFVLAFLGVFLAKITGENPLERALVFLSGGIVTGIIVFLLEGKV